MKMVYIGEIAPDAEGVIHSTVLEHFQFREEDLYNQPRLNTLTNDAVYASTHSPHALHFS
jgi:hypothetical protein